MPEFGSICRWQQMVFTSLPTNGLFIHSEMGVIFLKKWSNWGSLRSGLTSLALDEIPLCCFCHKDSRRVCRHCNTMWYLPGEPIFPHLHLEINVHAEGLRRGTAHDWALSLCQAWGRVGDASCMHSVGNPDLEIWRERVEKKTLRFLTQFKDERRTSKIIELSKMW